MSTAKFDTLSNVAGTQTVPVATVAQGSAKAWVNFNGTGTIAIRASFNVSSITDVAAGQYEVNFTTAMSDANYSVVAVTGTSISSFGYTGAGAVDSTKAYVATYNPPNFADAPSVSVAVFR
jgi:hypothetical protein